MKTTIATILLAASSLGLTACGKKDDSFETEVTLTRLNVVRKDKKGVAATLDAEFSFAECPGTQIEVVRGDKEFSACMAKHKVGDKVPLEIRYFFSDEGHYDYEVVGLAGCAREPDPHDESSFRMIRECEPWKSHDSEVGFICRMKPEKALLDKCPWFSKD